MSFARNVTLTEAWRWQGGTTFPDLVGPQGGVVSPDGNLVVAGAGPMHPENTPSDHAARLAIVKLDGETGEQLWVSQNQSSVGGDNRALPVDVDIAGDIIVGWDMIAPWDEGGSSAGGHHAVFKLNGKTGDKIWQCRAADRDEDIGTTVASEEEMSLCADGSVSALAIDSQGDAFIVGFARGEEFGEQGAYNDTDYFVGKLDGSTGEELWSMSVGPDDTFHELLACDVDSRDHLIAAGLTTGGVDGVSMGGSDLLVMKFDGDGENVWDWRSGTEYDEILLGVAVDREDNIYVAGGEGIAAFDAPIGNASIVRKLHGSNGTEIWSYRSEATLGSVFRAVSVDEASGVVVAAGVTEVRQDDSSSSGGYDFDAVALNASTGRELGRWQAGTPLRDVLGVVGFDEAGALYLGGYSEGEWAPEGAIGVEEGTPSSAVVKFVPPLYVFPGDNGAPRPGGSKGDEWKIATAVVASALVLVILACGFKQKSINDNLKSTVEDFTSVYQHKPGSTDPEAQPTTWSVKARQAPLARHSSRGLSLWSSRGVRAVEELAPATSSIAPPPMAVVAAVQSTRLPVLQRYFSQRSLSVVPGGVLPVPPKYRSRRTLMFARFVVGAPPPSPIGIAPKRGGGGARALLPADADDVDDRPPGFQDATPYTSPIEPAALGMSAGVRSKATFDTASRSMNAEGGNPTAVIPPSGSSAPGDTRFTFDSAPRDAVSGHFANTATPSSPDYFADTTSASSPDYFAHTTSASSPDYYVRSPSILNSDDFSDTTADTTSYAATVEDRLAKLTAVSSPLASFDGDAGGTKAPFFTLHDGLDSASDSAPPYGNSDSTLASVFYQGSPAKKTMKTAFPPLDHSDSASCSVFDIGETTRKSFRSVISTRSTHWDSASGPAFRARVRSKSTSINSMASAEAAEHVNTKFRLRPPRFGPRPQRFGREDSASGSAFGSSGSWSRRHVITPLEHSSSASGSVFLERTKRTRATKTANLRAERINRGRAEAAKTVSRGIIHVDSAAGSVFEGGSNGSEEPRRS